MNVLPRTVDGNRAVGLASLNAAAARASMRKVAGSPGEIASPHADGKAGGAPVNVKRLPITSRLWTAWLFWTVPKACVALVLKAMGSNDDGLTGSLQAEAARIAARIISLGFTTALRVQNSADAVPRIIAVAYSLATRLTVSATASTTPAMNR